MTEASHAPSTADALRQRIEASFVRQGMMRHLQARLVSVAPGEVEIALPYSERVTQQQGGYHGGAMGALADIAAGYAGLTCVAEGMEVATVEYKINFLAAFKDGELRARGHVVRAGKRLVITTAEVIHLDADGTESPCALMQQTLAVVKQTY
ncbi:PaaI family thioesterase [Limnohabitans sp.]|uniref:PaaI family thioesterase n=1 Tax=Limnohabitans sp. TaxID=1907725 RepID=UPI0038BA8A6D